MDNNYTVQDLQDNLNYLDETKQLIKAAIIEKRTRNKYRRHI